MFRQILLFCVLYIIGVVTLWLGWVIPQNREAKPSELIATTDGFITASACWNHARVEYKYEIHGQTFVGKGQADGRPCHELKIGDRIAVWYNRSVPMSSTPYDPSASQLNNAQAAGMVAAFFAVVVIGVYLFGLMLEKNKAKNQKAV